MKITIHRVATKKIFTSLTVGLLLFSTLFAFSSSVIVHAASVDSLPINVSSGVAAVTITDNTNPSYSVSLTSFPTPFSYQEGDSLTFSVTPATGYSFADWAFTFVSNGVNTTVLLNPYTQPTYSGWSLFAECALSTPQNCFGYTSIGSSTEQISGSNSKLYGTEFSLPYSTSISSMSVYLSGSITAPYPTAEVALYSANYTLMADSANQSITTAGWYTFSVSTTLSAGTYFLVVYGQSPVWTSGNYLTVYYESPRLWFEQLANGFVSGQSNNVSYLANYYFIANILWLLPQHIREFHNSQRTRADDPEPNADSNILNILRQR
jgi:hypothetical protein